MPGIQKQVPKKPKRTPDEWGMLKPAQLEGAVLMELNVDRIKTDSDGNRFLWRMPPIRVFVPKDEVEHNKKRGYVVCEDAMHWSKYKPSSDEREPLSIEPIDDWADPVAPEKSPEKPKGSGAGKSGPSA